MNRAKPPAVRRPSAAAKTSGARLLPARAATSRVGVARAPTRAGSGRLLPYFRRQPRPQAVAKGGRPETLRGRGRGAEPPPGSGRPPLAQCAVEAAWLAVSAAALSICWGLWGAGF